jgi:hypothetical protein
MPKIIIETCNMTPNFDALEAVAKTMMANYVQRDYMKERDVRVSTGRNLRVLEHEKPEGGPCDCRYSVTLVPNSN